MDKIIKIFVAIVISVIGLTTLIFVAFYQIYPLKYKESITYYSKNYHIPASLVASLINVESHFDKNATSSVGAIGLMQLLPTTASFIAAKEKLDASNLHEPNTNIELGCAYLKYLKDKFDDFFTTLCAYNAGEGNVMTWLANKNYSQNQQTLSTTPFAATNYYANKVLHDEKIYQKFFTQN